LKVAICCGGTGGHVFPGLTVAGELFARGHDVVLWLAGRNVESSVLAGWKGDVITVKAEGFSGGGFRSARALVLLFVSFIYSLRKMRTSRPDVVLAMGSYSSVGPVLAARILGIPSVLHEANAVPGRAVSFLSRYSSAIATSYESTSMHLPGCNCVYTGFPVRQRIIAADRSKNDSDHYTVLVLGGSLGAHVLNEVAAAAVCALHRSGMKIRTIHLTGLKDESDMRSRYQKAGVPCEVHGFLSEMERAYCAADLAICRAGGATCAELGVVGLFALLVPLPNAPRDHQMANALAVRGQGRADVVEQKDLTVDWLVEYLQKKILHRSDIVNIRAPQSGRPVIDGTVNLAGLVETTGKSVACPR